MCFTPELGQLVDLEHIWMLATIDLRFYLL